VRADSGYSGSSRDKALDRIGQFGYGLLPVQLEGRSSPEKWFDGLDVVSHLGLLFRGLAVGVVSPSAHAVDEHVKWRAEEDDVIKAVIEASLVLAVPETITSRCRAKN
jgi:hypothetical protein